MSGPLAIISRATVVPIARAGVNAAMSSRGREFAKAGLKALIGGVAFDAFLTELNDAANDSGTVGDILRKLGVGGETSGPEGDTQEVRILTPKLERATRALMARTGLRWTDLVTLTRLIDEQEVLLQYARSEDGFNG